MLVCAGRCSDPLGRQFDVETCGHFDEGWSIKKVSRLLWQKPYVVSLYVDLNQLSVADVLITMNRIRAHWNPRQKGLFVFRFVR